MAVGKPICFKEFTVQANKNAKPAHTDRAHYTRVEYVELEKDKLSNREGGLKQMWSEFEEATPTVPQGK